MLRQKRAQVSFYIIIGLILFIGFLFLFYFQQRIVTEPAITAPLERVAEEVPLETQPIKLYAQDCLDQIFPEAIRQVGLHGGYSDPENPATSGILFNLDKGNPTESDGVYLGDIPVIYWYHMNSPNKCAQCTLSMQYMPTLGSIVNQIDDYVRGHWNDCLENFSIFEEQGFEIETGEMDIQTILYDNDIRTLIDFPITINKEGRSTIISKFFSQAEVDLLPMYILANTIVLTEVQGLYLEQILLNLITAYSGATTDKLPPFSFIERKEYYTIWTKAMVGPQLQEILKTNIPIMQVDKTKGAEKIIIPGDDITTGLYDTLYIESPIITNLTSIANETVNLTNFFSNITVNFYYFDWPIYYDITPSEGEILRPSVVRSEFPFDIIRPYKTNYYDFFYDVSFPIIVELRHQNALNGEGFSLMFAMEGTIIDNKNLLQWNRGKGTFGDADYDTNVMQLNAPPGTSIRNQTKRLMCNENQRVGREIRLRAVDASTDQPIEDVEVYFGCGDYDTCDMGSTSYNATLNLTRFKGRLPIAMGCFIKLEKEGYEEYFISEVDATEDLPYIKTAKMEPLKRFNISIKQRRVSNINDPEDLAPTDTVILTIKRLETDNIPERSSTMLFNIQEIPGLPDNMTNLTIPYEIELIAGEYEVNAQILDQVGVVIPRCAEHICEGPFGTCLWADECVPDEDLEIKPLPIGGLALNERTQLWEVTREEMDGNFKNVTLTLLRFNNPSSLDEMQDLANLEPTISNNLQKFEPVFI